MRIFGIFSSITARIKEGREAQHKLEVACCKLDRLVLSSEKPKQKDVKSSVEIESTSDGGFIKITRFFFPNGDFEHAEVLLQDPFGGPRSRIFVKTSDGKLTVKMREEKWVNHDKVRLCDLPMIEEIVELFRNTREAAEAA